MTVAVAFKRTEVHRYRHHIATRSMGMHFRFAGVEHATRARGFRPMKLRSFAGGDARLIRPLWTHSPLWA